MVDEFVLVFLVIILGNIFLNGWEGLSWRFVSTIPKKDFFEPGSAAVLPMIVGTTIRVFVMTLFAIPIGVITAIYLTEYASTNMARRPPRISSPRDQEIDRWYITDMSRMA